MNLGPEDEESRTEREPGNQTATSGPNQTNESFACDEYFSRLSQVEEGALESSIKSYLLGASIPADERERLEQWLTADDENFAHLRLMEAELIDDYVLGTLTEVEEKNFEDHFLSTPERRASLKVAESLREIFRQPETLKEATYEDWERHPEWSYALIFTGFPALEPETAEMYTNAASLSLTSLEAYRGEDARRVNIPAETGELRLELILAPGVAASRYYSAEVRGSDNRLLLRLNDLQAQAATSANAVIVLSLPANSLPEDAYKIYLYAQDKEDVLVNSYSFAVAKPESKREQN